MENKTNKKQSLLLPVFYKKIGLTLMVLAFVPALVIKLMNMEMLQSQKDLFRILSLNIFILGLALVAWSRDRIEDEMMLSIRLRSMFWALGWAVLYVIFQPVVDLLFKDQVTDLSGQQLVISILFVYLIVYYLQKIGR